MKFTKIHFFSSTKIALIICIVVAFPQTNFGQAIHPIFTKANKRFTEAWSAFSLGELWEDSHQYGAWIDRFGGYGTVGIVQGPFLDLAPKVSTSLLETHSALVT